MTLPSGERRYEVRVELPPRNGKRRQKKKRTRTIEEAKDFYSRHVAVTRSSSRLAPSKITVRMAIDQYVEQLDVAPNTLNSYVNNLRPAIDLLGDMRLQKVEPKDVARLVSTLRKGGMLAGDWRRPPGTAVPWTPYRMKPWKQSSVNGTIHCLREVWKMEMSAGVATYNVPATVRRDPVELPVRSTLTAAQVTVLYRAVANDRLEHMFYLALHGLRRGEVAGLRWSDVDLESEIPTISISSQRTTNRGAVTVRQTKSRSSTRTLPIPSTLLPVLRRAKKRAESEAAVAGTQWSNSGYLVSKPLGEAYHPNYLGELWQKALADAGLPRVRFHDARHTCGTLMHLNGVPMAVIAAWLGHANPTITQRIYAHSQQDALRLGGELLSTLTALDGDKSKPSENAKKGRSNTRRNAIVVRGKARSLKAPSNHRAPSESRPPGE
ncbi:hypothetical protein AXK58_14335 [Tsukamurella tyrosinosolvens]|nr:hypothetical protein AXK58_14335 [Tsukamurella tyrosinosolvens]